MGSFTETTYIAASPDAVWAILSDIGEIARWNPGLIGSHRTNDTTGVGSCRHCDLSARHSLTEQVVHFDPARAITFRITESTMPFQAADIAFDLADHDQGTQVSVSPTYTLKYGPIGRLLDRTVVRRTYRKGMRGLLAGLKQYAEQAPPPP